MIRIFIVDDHPMVIAGIHSLLLGSTEFSISGSANDAFQAVEWLKKEQADIALVDINLPDMNGIELCAELKRLAPNLKILGLSTFKERSFITKMLEAGASGYLLKNAGKDELEEALKTVFEGRMFLNAEIAKVLTQPGAEKPKAPLLTAREKEVLALIAEGNTNAEIAEQLFVSQLTVDSHRKNLLYKFGVKNTAAMVKYGYETGLLK